MPQQIVIAEQLRVAALLTDDRVDELIVAQGRYQIGDVYLGTVENVLPGIDAAFVNIGESEKNGFIHVSDLGPLKRKKTSAAITELLEPKQKVLVQVMKEPTGNKGPRLTGNLALPGRYLVLQPHGQGVNISRRISLESERNRLKALGVLIKPPGAGLLIRTEAEGINEELLIDDLENLLKQWEAIQQASDNSSPPILLNRDDDFIQRVLRDHIGDNLLKVIVDSAEAVERVNRYLAQETNNISIEFTKNPEDLLENYKINSAINAALKPRVDLPSGGYIIVEPTEALTVIDVNSGSFTRSANSRETVLWTNCEAAIEIARQLKLRNIGGVIIIDFIDMDTRRDQLQLLEHFTSAINNDSARPQIAQLTELGLVELTRKRQGQNIYELFGKTNSNFQGKGDVQNITIEDINPTISSEAKVNNSTLIVGNEIEYDKGNNIKKKNINKVKDSETNLINEESKLSANTSKPISSKIIGEEDFTNKNNNKQEKNIMNITMSENEENVYSQMGLNPILLLDEPTNTENFTVHIIRPVRGEEGIKNKNTIYQDSNNLEENQNIKIEKSHVDLDEGRDDLISADEISNNEKNELNSTEIKEADEDPRRKRRRSSAAS